MDTNIFQELTNYVGVNAVMVFSYKTGEVVFHEGKLPFDGASTGKEVGRFLNTFEKKQQSGMDIDSDWMVFVGTMASVGVSKSEDLRLICLLGQNADMFFLREKVQVLWMQLKLLN